MALPADLRGESSPTGSGIVLGRVWAATFQAVCVSAGNSLVTQSRLIDGVFEFSAPSRIRTCAHGSGDRVQVSTHMWKDLQVRRRPTTLRCEFYRRSLALRLCAGRRRRNLRPRLRRRAATVADSVAAIPRRLSAQ